MKREDFYFCYSSKVAQYLKSKGFRYLFMARELNKGNPFSLYEKTQELSEALETYKLNK